MNKLTYAALAASTLFAAAMPAQAVDVAKQFDVTVALTSVCTMATINPLDFGPYTAFGGAKSGSTSAVLTCTRGLTGVTANFDTAGTVASGEPTSIAEPTGRGVVAGLHYTLSTVLDTSVTGTAATAAAGGTGSAATITYTINGNMPAGQAGDATAAAASSTQTRTFTVTY